MSSIWCFCPNSRPFQWPSLLCPRLLLLSPTPSPIPSSFPHSPNTEPLPISHSVLPCPSMEHPLLRFPHSALLLTLPALPSSIRLRFLSLPGCSIIYPEWCTLLLLFLPGCLIPLWASPAVMWRLSISGLVPNQRELPRPSNRILH